MPSSDDRTSVSPSLAKLQARAHAEASERWPNLRQDRDAFSQRLAQLEGQGLDPKALAALHLADLLLATSCLAREPTALAILEKELLPKVAPSLRRVDAADSFVDEALQLVRERVLLGSPRGPARLTEYGGRGPLVKWLRAVAVRVALNLKAPSSAKADVRLEETLAEAVRMSGADPEFTALAGQLRGHFDAALRAAIAALTPEERLLLRLHLVEGLSIDKLNRILGVHRATAARKLAAARQALLGRTRREMTQRVGHLVSRGELKRVAALAQSQLDLSLDRLFRQ